MIGLIISYSQAFDYGLAHVKSLENDKIHALRVNAGNFDASMKLSKKAKQDVAWWNDNILLSGKHIELASPDIVLYTDASYEGWGAHSGPSLAGGRWNYDELQFHINVLELKAIFLALQSFCHERAQHVRIMTDNTTALAYVKHMGGVRSIQCNEVAHDIWSWCENKYIWLTIAHIPGVDNVLADFKSRKFSDDVEWKLSAKLFAEICGHFGMPNIDLFASRLNAKLPTYVSWTPDPGAFAIDAFSIQWSNCFFYAFPPFSCIRRCITKILQEEATGVLVVPWWPTQTWWARLWNLNLPNMRFRPKNNNLLPVGNPRNVLFINRCPLGAFLFTVKPF